MIDGTRQSRARIPSQTMAGKARSPRATGGQIAPARAIAIGVNASQPDHEIERTARPVRQQDECGRERPADDERDGDEPEFEGADTHRGESIGRRHSGADLYGDPQVPGTGGTAGSSPVRNTPVNMRHTAPDRPVRRRSGTRGHVGHGRTGGSAGHGVTGDHLAPARRCPGLRQAPRPDLGSRPPGPVPKRQTATPAMQAPGDPPVYRLLLMKGLTPTEAANLTAFLCGLPTSDLALVAQAGQPAAVPARDAPDGPLRRHRRGAKRPH